MNTCIEPLTSLARSISLPERPAPTESEPGVDADAVVPPRRQSARSLSVSFAPAPLDVVRDHWESPGGVDIVTLQTPSISAVVRNFGVLAKRYQDASRDEKRAAFQKLVLSGSAMFTDFLERDVNRCVDEAWGMKGSRMSERKSQRPRSCMLGELASLSKGLGEARPVYLKADHRRALLRAEVQQLVECVAEQHELEHTPALQGILVGCMLDGAMHALNKNATFLLGQTDIKGSVLALCNAIEDVCSTRSASLLRSKTESVHERTMAWKNALIHQPEQIVERCARTVSANPAGNLPTEAHKMDFRQKLAATRNEGYGPSREPQI